MANNKKEVKETDEAKKKRIEKCTNRIQGVLKEENCKFDVAVLLKAGQVIPQIAIISN